MKVDIGFLRAKFGPYESTKGGRELLFDCPNPACGRHKFYINPVKGKAYCQRCHYSIEFTDTNCDVFNTPLYRKDAAVEPPRNWLGLPSEAKPLWLDPSLSGNVLPPTIAEWKRASAYVKDVRGFDDADIKKYDLHYAQYGTYGGRIIFPLTYHGEIYNWIGRDYRGRSERDDAFPKVLDGPKTRFAEEVYAHMGIDACLEARCKDIVLVEGPFDLMSVGSPPGIALHGTHLPNLFLSFLLRTFSGFVLMLDPGSAGTDGAKKIESVLVGSGKPVVVVQNLPDDPAAIGKKTSREIVQDAFKRLL